MKKRNLLLASAIGISAIAMAACTDEAGKTKEGKEGEAAKESKLNPQERFTEGFVDLYEATSLQTTVTTKVTANVEDFLKEGMTQEEAELLKTSLESMDIEMKLTANEKYAEAIASMKMQDEELGLDLNAEIPILIDIENEKVYMGTDWMVEMFGTMAKAALSETEMDKTTLKEVDSAISALKKGQFIDMDNISEESLFADMGMEDLLQTEGLGFNKATTEEIQALTTFLKTLKATDFVENADGAVTVKFADEQIDQFNEVTGLLNLGTDVPDLEGTGETAEIADVKDMKITASFQGDLLDGLQLDFTATSLEGYSYAQSVFYKDIKMNKDVKTTYTPDTIDVMTVDEEASFNEELSGLLMIAIFAAMGSEMGTETGE